MYIGAAPVYFICAGTRKKSEMLYIIWLNIVGAIHFITVAKSKMYFMGVKSIASWLTFYTKINKGLELVWKMDQVGAGFHKPGQQQSLLLPVEAGQDDYIKEICTLEGLIFNPARL